MCEQLALPVTGILYGLSSRFGFVFLDLDTAVAWAGEVAEISACTTLGDFRRLVPRLEYADCPLDPDDDRLEDLPDEHPVSLNDFEDWPPRDPLYAQDWLPDQVVDELIERAGGDFFDTRLWGDFFFVPADREADMIAVFARHGLAHRRDDSLFWCVD